MIASTRGRMFLGIALVLPLAAACSSQSTPSPTTQPAIDESHTTIGLINTMPNSYVGRTVTVMGSVKYIYTPRMLLLTDPTDMDILVLVDVDSPVPNVAVNDKVQTTGNVSIFGVDMSPSSGVGLGGTQRMSDQFYNRWVDRPVIVAVQVAPVGLTGP
ncbi:MAG: hypothetical protein LLG01_20025 [Planctomycetaceae bacterium]|nr:hypothetical protein [Planctomycetaceae bacterium]